MNCQHCGQGAISHDADGPICPDCIDSGWFDEGADESLMLTTAEQKWLKRVQRALDACPSDDLGFYTVGDDDVSVYRRPKNDFVDEAMTGNKEFATFVEDADARLGQLNFPAAVHSTAG